MKERINLQPYYIYIDTDEVEFQTHVTGREFENEWLSITTSGKMVVHGTNRKGYAWDGCSPKWIWRDLVWGTPDGRLYYHAPWDKYKPITYYASMLHDVLYQFKNEVPVSRFETDVIFRNNLKSAQFKWSGLYYFAVRNFGGLYGKWKTK